VIRARAELEHSCQPRRIDMAPARKERVCPVCHREFNKCVLPLSPCLRAEARQDTIICKGIVSRASALAYTLNADA
jgi:hypothetical protein